MKTLVIEALDGRRLARVTRLPGGALDLVSEAPEHDNELRALLREVTSQPLKLREFGEEPQPGGGSKYLNVVRIVTPDHPRYLEAIAEGVTRRRARIGGALVCGYVEQAEEGVEAP